MRVTYEGERGARVDFPEAAKERQKLGRSRSVGLSLVRFFHTIMPPRERARLPSRHFYHRQPLPPPSKGSALASHLQEGRGGRGREGGRRPIFAPFPPYLLFFALSCHAKQASLSRRRRSVCEEFVFPSRVSSYVRLGRSLQTQIASKKLSLRSAWVWWDGGIHFITLSV